MAKKKYTIDHFIEKFKAIPANKWTTGTYKDSKGRCCAQGHCGSSGAGISREGSALSNLGVTHGRDMFMINDGKTPKYQQKSPKARVLAALVDIKEEL